MKVGVFDSGIGGLTVVKSLLEHKIFSDVIYYGDTARVPYGNKDKNTIIRYSLEALEFFKNFDIDILIVACNTASAFALDELRNNTNIPVVGVIEAGILSLNNKNITTNEHILILGTKATISSKKYEDALTLKGYKNISSIATGLFVSIVEECLEDTQILDKTLEHYFDNLPKIDAVILGCTHFPLIEHKISKYLKEPITIHSGEAIVELLKLNYNCTNNFKNTNVQFFASENPDGLKKIAKRWLGELI